MSARVRFAASVAVNVIIVTGSLALGVVVFFQECAR